MIIVYWKNRNGSWTFSGYLRRTYFGHTLAECKRLYRQECIETGWYGRVTFVKEEHPVCLSTM